jgi:hypothetical protein
MSTSALRDWLFAHAGPIIRWRLVRDFAYPLPRRDMEALREAVLATDEVRRWLAKLGGSHVHGSRDTDAENGMAKLVECGLRAGIREFDAKMLPYVGLADPMADAFLIAAGYGGQRALADRFRERLGRLHDTAVRGSYDLYLTAEEASAVPRAWRGKPIYRPEFAQDNVPSCYDLYALAHWRSRSEAEQGMIENVVAYLSHPEFQNTVGGYLWDRDRHRCYAAGRTWLACLTPERLVLFLELTARFASARRRAWFSEALAGLEEHRTENRTYCFPPELLKERRDSYYIYAGAHMGLGESRRRRQWLEIESTFRMLNIKRLMGAQEAGSSGSTPQW